MKRKTRIIQISGVRGILFALFVVICLSAGFIAFPSIVAMHAWNFVAEYLNIPSIQVWQGLLLWGIVAITGYIINDKQKYLSAFSAKDKLTEDELNKIMARAKIHAKARALESMYMNEIKNEEKSVDENKKENV